MEQPFFCFDHFDIRLSCFLSLGCAELVEVLKGALSDRRGARHSNL